MLWVAFLFLAWVTFEYIFIGSSRSIPVEKHLVVKQSEFITNKIVILQKQSIPLLLITKNKLNGLKENKIYLAIGNEGCVVLPISNSELKESCSNARYSIDGRSITQNVKPLISLKYHFNSNTKIYSLTLNSDMY